MTDTNLKETSLIIEHWLCLHHVLAPFLYRTQEKNDSLFNRRGQSLIWWRSVTVWAAEVIPLKVNACVCLCVVVSHVWFLETPWTVASHGPLSIGFPRQEYWSGLPLPPLRNPTCVSCICGSCRWIHKYFTKCSCCFHLCLLNTNDLDPLGSREELLCHLCDKAKRIIQPLPWGSPQQW